MAARNTVPITIVAAVARNGVIGGGNQLLWRLSSDLKRFKALTMGKPLIMGRKTFESIGKALPGRETIMVTSARTFDAAGVHLAPDLNTALALAERLAGEMGADEVIIAGGGEIYAAAMDRADQLVVTHVDVEPEGDTYFPAIDPETWSEISRETGVQTDRDEASFSFAVYERVKNAGH